MSKVTHAKLVIIGSGPAGCTAAIYAARAMLEPIMIRGVQAGGQLTITTDVENYPGFAEVIQGPWLMEQMEKQAEHVGTRLVADHVMRLDLKQRPFRIECDQRRHLPRRGRGARDRRAGALARSSVRAEVQGLSAFPPAPPATASSIAASEVFVIGGGNTAVEEALFLTNFASKVTVVHRRDHFRAEKILQDRLFKNPKIEVIWDTVLHDVLGDDNPLKVAASRCATSRPARSPRSPPTACSSRSAIRRRPNWCRASSR